MLTTRFLMVLFFLLLFNASADSPATSINFAHHYTGNHLVSAAITGKTLTLELMQAFSDPELEVGVKAAIISGLGWSYKRQNNASIYRNFLVNKNEIKESEFELEDMEGYEIFCLGYLILHDDVLSKTDKALETLQVAKKKMPGSYTVAAVIAMVKGQTGLKDDWCEIWRQGDNVNTTPSLHHDLKRSARVEFTDYMNSFKKYCK